MTMRISYRAITQYGLLYMVMVLGGAFVLTLNENLIVSGSLAIVVYLYLKSKRYIDQKTILYLFFLLIAVFFVRFNAGGTGPSSWMLWAAQILISCAAYQVDKRHFFERYLQIIVFLCVVSLIGSAMKLLSPNLLTSILTPTVAAKYNNDIYYGKLLYVMVPSSLRNNGFYSEPGRFQIVPLMGLYSIWFLRVRIGITNKKVIKYSIIFIITLISTMSATGYLGLLAILAGFLIDYRKSNNSADNKLRNRILLLLVILIFWVIYDFYAHGTDSILENFLFSKVNDAVVNGESSGGARITALTTAIRILISNPMGIGFKNIADIFAGLKAAGAGIMSFAAAMGVVPFVVTLVWLVKPILTAHISMTKKLVLLFLYFNTAFAQTYVFYPVILTIVFTLKKEVFIVPEGGYLE